MAEYSITFARSARKELEKLPINIAERIVGKITLLSANPRPNGVAKLQGRNNLWRMRVGEYRIIYSIDDNHKIVDISVIRHRRDVYRDL